MLIPFSERKIKPGDKVVVKRVLTRSYFIVPVGHILTYIGTDKNKNPGDILKDEETGTLVKYTSCLDYSLYEPSLEKAKKKYIYLCEKAKVLKIIFNECQKSSPQFGFIRCEITKNTCSPSLSCLEYLPKKCNKKPIVFKFNRLLKINKLTKK